jgi:hypothetical protein
MKELQDSGYVMMQPMYPSEVTATTAHQKRRGHSVWFERCQKNARKHALTDHRQLQKSTVDANWHFR